MFPWMSASECQEEEEEKDFMIFQETSHPFLPAAEMTHSKPKISSMLLRFLCNGDKP